MKQREEAETFCERHTENRLDEDFARSGGIAADSFGGVGARVQAEHQKEVVKRLPEDGTFDFLPSGAVTVIADVPVLVSLVAVIVAVCVPSLSCQAVIS